MVPSRLFSSPLNSTATRAAEMRTQLAEMGDQYKASFNDIVIKAVALALAEHPEVNAHWLNDKIRQFNRIHVAMAVAVEDGLITTVLFDADRLSLWEISEKARDLAKRARERKLMPEEYTGSTFSVSNLGMFGIDQFHGDHQSARGGDPREWAACAIASWRVTADPRSARW